MSESPNKIPLEVTKAVEFKEIKKLPKFSHANMAVINPVHRESPTLSPTREPKIRLVGSPVKYELKEFIPKILPDHLIRPPPELFSQPTNKEKSVDDIIRIKEGKEGRKLNSREKMDIIEKEKKKEENRK